MKTIIIWSSNLSCIKKKLVALLAIIILNILPGNYCFSQKNWIEEKKLYSVPRLSNINDEFGTSVAMDKDVIIIGSQNYKEKGCVYIISNDGINDTLGILTASDGAGEDYFGSSVCVSGNVIVVGAYNSKLEKGSAYVFVKPISGWQSMTETAILTASDGAASDYFGRSVSIHNNVIVVGADGENGNFFNYGAAYVFVEPESGWASMTQTAKLNASDGSNNDYFGYSVCISDSVIAIGAYGVNSDQGSAYIFDKPSSGWENMTETAILSASDGMDSDHFGGSISIQDNVVVIGAYADDDNGNYSGSAYVYVKPEPGWSNMTETAKLTASDGSSDDVFGYSVCISNDVILVGTYYNWAYIFEKPGPNWTNMTETAKLTGSDGNRKIYPGNHVSIHDTIIIIGVNEDDVNGQNSGSAYVYYKPESGWANTTETKKILPVPYLSSVNDYFGFSVAVNEKYIVVGSTGLTGVYDVGKAFVFSRQNNYDTLAVLTASDGSPGDGFGMSVSISDTVIAVGARGDYMSPGSAYIYVKPASGWESMTQTAILTASDGAFADNFGGSIDIQDSVVIVGAKNDDDDGSNSGSAYVFVKPGSGWTDMTETAKLRASDGGVGNNLGSSVSIHNDVIVIGATYSNSDKGSVYVYTKPESGWMNTTQTAILTLSVASSGEEFGNSVDIYDSIIVVGQHRDFSNRGAAHVFSKPLSGWTDMTETAKITPLISSSDDYFGSSVSIHDSIIVIGSYGDDDNWSRSGSVYIYIKPGTSWNDMKETYKLTTSDARADDYFGTSVAISDSLIIVGANGNDDLGNASGAAYIFLNSCKSFSRIFPVECESYSSPSNKYTWTTSGTYIDTIPNTSGCDSIITINLTILHSTSSTINPAVCNNY
ncbi:FG-GAP repeat protein, partial [Bacteroidota bacterium]